MSLKKMEKYYTNTNNKDMNNKNCLISSCVSMKFEEDKKLNSIGADVLNNLNDIDCHRKHKLVLLAREFCENNDFSIDSVTDLLDEVLIKFNHEL